MRTRKSARRCETAPRRDRNTASRNPPPRFTRGAGAFYVNGSFDPCRHADIGAAARRRVALGGWIRRKAIQAMKGAEATARPTKTECEKLPVSGKVTDATEIRCGACARHGPGDDDEGEHHGDRHGFSAGPGAS